MEDWQRGVFCTGGLALFAGGATVFAAQVAATETAAHASLDHPLTYVGLALAAVGLVLFVGGFREWSFLTPGPSVTDLQREAFKTLLLNQIESVRGLLGSRDPVDTTEDAEWINRTHRIVTAAVGNAEARLVLDPTGLRSDHSNDPWRKLDFQRQRLISLSERVDSLKIRRDFDPARVWPDQ
jgi:hypothetical protein